jgi:hypothetical protein
LFLPELIEEGKKAPHKLVDRMQDGCEKIGGVCEEFFMPKRERRGWRKGNISECADAKCHWGKL